MAASVSIPSKHVSMLKGRIMGIPIARVYEAKTAGSAVKRVQCENCSTTFVYSVKRMCTGGGMGIAFLDDEGAQQRAQQEAARALKKALDAAIEVVPCPRCGWIQADMKALARRQHLPRLKIAGLALLVLSFIYLILIAIIGIGVQLPVDRPAADLQGDLVFLIAVAGVTLLLGRIMACQQFDPNDEDVELRLQKGRDRAMLLSDLEKENPA